MFYYSTGRFLFVTLCVCHQGKMESWRHFLKQELTRQQFGVFCQVVICLTVDRFVSQPPHDPIIKLYRSVVGIQTKASFKSERGPSEGDVVSTLVQRLETLGGAKSH